MKSLKDIFESRTSIRRYERENISQSDIETIYSAIRNTPTSYNAQQFSVIEIDDRSIKEQLYEITRQKQIKTCNRFFVFCADFNKISLAAYTKGIEMPDICSTADGLILGIVDASLAMMNAVMAAHMLGLGCCCIGYTRTANPQKIAQLLNLPKGVFVVCGLSIGVPREYPDVKPKQPLSLIIHKNRYSDKDEIVNKILEYDNIVSIYNRTRVGAKSDNDWIGHMVDYYAEAMNYNILDYLHNQGFNMQK